MGGTYPLLHIRKLLFPEYHVNSSQSLGKITFFYCFQIVPVPCESRGISLPKVSYTFGKNPFVLKNLVRFFPMSEVPLDANAFHKNTVLHKLFYCKCAIYSKINFHIYLNKQISAVSFYFCFSPDNNFRITNQIPRNDETCVISGAS